VIRHAGCGGEIDDRRSCAKCGKLLEPHEAQAEPGPGAVPETVA
jgi:hypothetical protein